MVGLIWVDSWGLWSYVCGWVDLGGQLGIVELRMWLG